MSTTALKLIAFISEGAAAKQILEHVREPAQWEVLSSEQRATYDGSPIEVGRFYFCHFFNEAWHMGESEIEQPYEMRFSGKVGPAHWVTPAEQFMIDRWGT